MDLFGLNNTLTKFALRAAIVIAIVMIVLAIHA